MNNEHSMPRSRLFSMVFRSLGIYSLKDASIMCYFIFIGRGRTATVLSSPAGPAEERGPVPEEQVEPDGGEGQTYANYIQGCQIILIDFAELPIP